MKRFVAIDGNSLMYRAYYALPNMMNKRGVPTGAVYGFISMLFKIADDFSPDYMAVAFDMKAPTFRHIEYSEYKAGRRETPDDLKKQFPIIKNLLRDMRVPVCECEGYEADDILGTFARSCASEGVNTLLVTGDRDALQLIDESTNVLITKKGISDTVLFDEKELFEQYGLMPKQMPDLKGLMGDASDNLPGVPGVGEKTALKLLHKYNTLEEVLERCESEEKGALREKLMNNKESARKSYKLGLIYTEVPIDTNIAGYEFDRDNMSGGMGLMQELELRKLAERLPKAAANIPAKQDEINIVTLKTTEEIDSILCNAGSPMAFYVDDVISFAFDNQTQYNIDLGGDLLSPGLDPQAALFAMKSVLENENIHKVVFDAKKLLKAVAQYGVDIKGIVLDEMIADYLLNAMHPSNSLKTLASERLGAGEAGAVSLFRLYEPMLFELREKNLYTLYTDIEHPLIFVLYSMEKEGFTVDVDMLNRLSDDFGARRDELANGIYTLCGHEFNILSTKQLGAVLFDELKLPSGKKTKTGYSTDADTLESISHLHPAVPLILQYRFTTKLKSTFLDGMLALVKNDTKKIHTTFNQNITATGRISSTEPNLQNIPVRTEYGRDIRKAFIAGDGNLLVDADYSQIELRVLAHISGDAAMIDAFTSGADIHLRTASEVFGVLPKLVTKEQRSAAKAVNFGIVYGISDFGLSKQLGISRKKASEYINMYLSRYPGIYAYLQESVEQGRKQGYAATLMGRRRDLQELKSSNFNTRSFGERVAMNMPIQGTAADIIKLAMVRVYNAIREKGLKARLILQIHDELIVEAPEIEVQTVEKVLKDCMENVIQLRVPLIADVNIGKSWYDTK